MKNLIHNVLVYTLADRGVELRESCVTDTLEGADCVATVGVFVTRVTGDTLVDVVVTVATRVTLGTLRTSGRFVARRVNVETAAVALTVLAPRTARTGCNHTCLLYLGTVFTL